MFRFFRKTGSLLYVSLFWLMGFSLAWANQTGDRNMLDRLGDYAIYAEDKIDTIDSLTPVILFDEDFEEDYEDDEDDEEERDDLLDDSDECEPDDNNDDCDDSDDLRLG